MKCHNKELPQGHLVLCCGLCCALFSWIHHKRNTNTLQSGIAAEIQFEKLFQLLTVFNVFFIALLKLSLWPIYSIKPSQKFTFRTITCFMYRLNYLSGSWVPEIRTPIWKQTWQIHKIMTPFSLCLSLSSIYPLHTDWLFTTAVINRPFSTGGCAKQ